MKKLIALIVLVAATSGVIIGACWLYHVTALPRFIIPYFLQSDEPLPKTSSVTTNIMPETPVMTTGQVFTATTKTEPPPGWGLQKSNDGKWRWVKDNGVAAVFEEDTRQQAIDAAWSYYQHLKEKRERVWEDE